MITRQQLEGQWNEIKGKLKEQWGELADLDLRQFEGNTEQLVGAIQQKTGATRERIERVLEEIAAETSIRSEQLAESARQYSQRASEMFQEQCARAEGVVRERPMQSLAAAFGAGIVAGLIVSLGFRSR